ncbi:MAG: type III pantothenate kinase [Oscillospiraceae bacterium]|nr:type III pantothenate kinase [Oscillospiraceae bacterium]
MILAIDIGNTNIVLGGIEKGNILFEARLATDHIKTSDQYAVDLKNVLSLYSADGAQFEGSIVSSVVPPVLNSIGTAIRKLTGKMPLVVGPGIKTGLNILLDNPGQTGGDLIVGAVAAVHEYRTPMALVDMGTATTISILNEKGALLGGCICPGVRISMEALSARTAQLPGICLDEPKRVIGRNTIDCMRSGILYGAASMLDGLLTRMEEELGQPLEAVATGGMSRFIAPLCKRKMIYDKDLLLKGLYILYEQNRK